MWIYAKDHSEEIKREPCCFEYIFEGKKHKYFPDFKYKGQLIEIKGKQFLKKDGTWQNPYNENLSGLYEAKHQCIINNNIMVFFEKDCQKYIDYINLRYGKDYLKQFRIH